MHSFIDIHHHILYGLDDGPETYPEMAQMLRAAAEDGIGTIYATPHMTPGVDRWDEALMQKHLTEANKYCRSEGLNLCVLPGAEILYSPALCNYVTAHELPTLGDTRCVLIEFSPSVPYADIENAVTLLNCFHYMPILAHVERYRCLRQMVSRFERLRNIGIVYFQVNCRSVLGANGYWTKRFVWKLVKAGIADFIASDAHNTGTRRCRMTDTYSMLVKNNAAVTKLSSFESNDK